MIKKHDGGCRLKAEDLSLNDAKMTTVKWEAYRIMPDGEAVQEQSVSLETLHQKEDATHVIVIHSLKRIFIYIGRAASPRLKFGASRFAKQLQKQLGPIYRLKTIEQFDESQEFLECLQDTSKPRDQKGRDALRRKKPRQKSIVSDSPQLRTKVQPKAIAQTVGEEMPSQSTVATQVVANAELSRKDNRHGPSPIAPHSPMTEEQKELNVFTDNATCSMFHHEGLEASTAIKVIDSSLLPNSNGNTYVRRISWSAKKSTKVKDYQVKFYVIPRNENSSMILKVTKKEPQFVLKLDSSNLIGSIEVDMFIPPAHDLYVAFRMELSMTMHFECV